MYIYKPSIKGCGGILWFFKCLILSHDDVIKYKHFPRYWPFVRGIHRSPVNSPHKGQWRGALMFALICVWINDWVNIREAGDLRRHGANYDVMVMRIWHSSSSCVCSAVIHFAWIINHYFKYICLNHSSGMSTITINSCSRRRPHFIFSGLVECFSD